MVLAEADGRLAEGGDAGRMSTKLSGISPTLSPSRAYGTGGEISLVVIIQEETALEYQRF